MSTAQHAAAVWRAEALQVLLWALGLADEMLPYDSEAGEKSIKAFPGAELNRVVSSAVLRDRVEVDKARAIAELWHWRARTWQLEHDGRTFPVNAKMQAAGIRSFADVVRVTARAAGRDGRIPPAIDDDFPAFNKAYRLLSPVEFSTARSIALERHFALNWLCGRAPDCTWDATPTDT